MPVSKCKNFHQKYQTGKNIKENGYHIITTNELEIILNYIFGVDVIGIHIQIQKVYAYIFRATTNYTISIVIYINNQMQVVFDLNFIIVSSVVPFLICDALRVVVPSV